VYSLDVSSSECQKYAVVHELISGVDRPTVVCSGSLRSRVVYLSQTNSIVIETFGGATDRDDDVTTLRHRDVMTRFLLQYQGKGFTLESVWHSMSWWGRPVLTVRAVATDCVVFIRVFLLCDHDNSRTAALSLMKFSINMFFDNRPKAREFQGHRSKVKVTGPVSDSLPLRNRAKKLVDTITHEPLHSAWWNLAQRCYLTTARTLLNFKVIGQRLMSFLR